MFRINPIPSLTINSRTIRTFAIAISVGFSSTMTLHAETAASVASQVQFEIENGTPPDWWTPELPEDIRKNVDNKGKNLAEKLDLENDSKTSTVAELISTHYARVWAWHQDVDESLDAGWDAWDEARSNADGKEKDELKALAIMTEVIDPIYAQFAPQIRLFLGELDKEIGEEKSIELLDRITRSPGAPRTYKAYLAMVPQMTDEEKAIIWDRLTQAREDSLAAWSGDRIVKIFKKHKIRNEFSIDYFGYGYRKSYKAWVEGSK